MVRRSGRRLIAMTERLVAVMLRPSPEGEAGVQGVEDGIVGRDSNTEPRWHRQLIDEQFPVDLLERAAGRETHHERVVRAETYDACGGSYGRLEHRSATEALDEV